MIGITSYGGYIPRLRLDRMAIYQNMGWFAPAIAMVAQGERSFCNWDEDSLTMAVAAAQDCLKGVGQRGIEGLYLASTTLPFSDRHCAGVVKSALNLPDEMVTADFTTCLRAGTQALVSGLSTVKSGDRKRILVAATDKRMTKTAYFYEMWFGDGAAAVTVGDKNVVAEYEGSFSVAHDFVDHYRGPDHNYDYMWEERWVRDSGFSEIVPQAVNGLFQKLSVTAADITKFVFPCLFKREQRGIAKKLGLDGDKLVSNLHEECGETGAAHPLVMLVHALETAEPGDRILVVGFGQGCDALLFRVTEEIKKLPARQGIRGSLKNKLFTDNYALFLKFRDLIKTEMGIRGEAPTQTAPTVLWRKRKMLHGLVGGKCTACGTPQFPQMDICVNPECRQHGTQEDYRFADLQAKVKTFTADMLAVSVNPPHLYGLIQFEGGGRFMSDFTDCTMEDVRVGQPVRMAFRKRYDDKDRGFSGYFWKAIPIPYPGGKDAVRFENQVAVVTGAGAGLGRVYALELAKRGAQVVVNDLGGARDGSGDGSQSAADVVVEEIQALGGDAVASYDSVSTPEGGEAIIDKAIDAFGRVDIVVNNAGILRDKSLAKLEPTDWNAVLSVHLHGAYNVTRPAVRHMRAQGYGRVVLTTSAAGLHGNFGQTNYSAAKLGLVGFMHTLKLEGQKYDIKVNTVAPLAITRLTEDIFPPELKDKALPEFVAPLVLDLCAEKCATTGEVYNAGMGFFSRSAVVTGPGKLIGDGKKVPTPEDVMRHWDEINSLEGAQEFNDATSALGEFLSAGTKKPEKKGAKEDKGGGLTVDDVFQRMPDQFLADKAAGVDVVFQYRISGEGGGTWYAVIKDQSISISEGEHDKPTTTISMEAPDFLALIQGQLNPMQAFTKGKLKIDGDLMKSQLIEKIFKKF